MEEYGRTAFLNWKQALKEGPRGVTHDNWEDSLLEWHFEMAYQTGREKQIQRDLRRVSPSYGTSPMAKLYDEAFRHTVKYNAATSKKHPLCPHEEDGMCPECWKESFHKENCMCGDCQKPKEKENMTCETSTMPYNLYKEINSRLDRYADDEVKVKAIIVNRPTWRRILEDSRNAGDQEILHDADSNYVWMGANVVLSKDLRDCEFYIIPETLATKLKAVIG